MWSDMLSHQLPVLPPLNDFWDALPEIFHLDYERRLRSRSARSSSMAGEIADTSRVLPMGVPLRSVRLWKSSASPRQTIYVSI